MNWASCWARAHPCGSPGSVSGLMHRDWALLFCLISFPPVPCACVSDWSMGEKLGPTLFSFSDSLFSKLSLIVSTAKMAQSISFSYASKSLVFFSCLVASSMTESVSGVDISDEKGTPLSSFQCTTPVVLHFLSSGRLLP